MYRRLTHAEFLCRRPDGGFLLNDVFRQLHRPLLDVPLQAATLPASCCSILCYGTRAYARMGLQKDPAAAMGVTPGTVSA